MKFASILLRTNNLVIIGGTIIVIFFFLFIFGEMIAPYAPNQADLEPLHPPCLQYPMGTDDLGRDVFSRVLCGAKWSLSIGVLSVLMSVSIGSLLGALSAYAGGWTDKVFSAIMDSIYAFPSFVLALLLYLIFTSSYFMLVLVITLVWIPGFFRLVRSITLSVKTRGYIDASRVIGASPFHIVRVHILPSYLGPLTVYASLAISRAIVTVSGLGFLGFGLPPPTPEWGIDLSAGRPFLLIGVWWMTFFPGLLIVLAVLGFNLLSEGLERMQYKEQYR